MRALKSRASFVFVSHRLDEVLQLSDRVYVMKDGEVVGELMTANADVTTLHRLMVGTSLQADYYPEPLQRPFQNQVVLEAEGLSSARPTKMSASNSMPGRFWESQASSAPGARS